MKKFTKFLVGLLLIGSIFVFPFWTTQAVKADSGYVIDDYYVEILVKKDGSYLITETIKVNFLELSRGIYRNLPTKYWMNWDIEGKTYVREYLFSISNIKVNEVNEIEKFKQGIQIRIGNPDVYIIGEKIYKLSYVVHTKDLDLEGRQLFYYNVIGTEWTTEIKHAHFSIKFENEIDYSNVQIYNGRANESKTNTKVSCQYNRNDYRIDCETTEALVSKEAITVWLHLPDDFFKFPDYTYLYILSSAFSSLLAFGLLVLYLRVGKDRDLVTTVEFTAPQGLNASSVGFVIDNTANTRDIVAQIIEWAKDNYLVIDDTEKRNLKFIKQRNLPETKPYYERVLFAALFRRREVATEKDLKGTFYTAIESAKLGVAKHFNERKYQLYENKSTVFKIMMIFIVWLPLILTLFVKSKYENYVYEPSITAIIFIVIMTIAYCLILFALKNNWRILAKPVKALITGIFIFVSLFVLMILLATFAGNSTSTMFFLINFGLTIMIIYLVVKFGRRTEFGSRAYGACLGLYDFIKTAEYDRLKLLAEENPYVFYDVLPYAYAFNLVSVWRKAFKNIALPPQEFYVGPGSFQPYLMMNRLNTSMSRIQNSTFAPPPPSGGSGGGSFGGGGGGFSGGGGSSGGGFGGGGGGRW